MNARFYNAIDLDNRCVSTCVSTEHVHFVNAVYVRKSLCMSKYIFFLIISGPLQLTFTMFTACPIVKSKNNYKDTVYLYYELVSDWPFKPVNSSL